MKRALITGVTGQDGSYLSELLLNDGFEVVGMVRRTSTFNRQRIEHLSALWSDKFQLVYGDMTDAASIDEIVRDHGPFDEVYNLAAQSHVGISFSMPGYTAATIVDGTRALLDSVSHRNPDARFYQAGTSEMFGDAPPPQNEMTPFRPRSPYAIAKVAAHWTVAQYREVHTMHASNGILFNHESPRRGENFVTQKIVRCAVSMIHDGRDEPIHLGNLDAERDWGHAKDFVDGMTKIVRWDRPEDWVLATGESHSVRDFVNEAFECLQVDVAWDGERLTETCLEKKTGRRLVIVDPTYLRPLDVPCLVGDPSAARSLLGWQSTTTFSELVSDMIYEASNE